MLGLELKHYINTGNTGNWAGTAFLAEFGLALSLDFILFFLGHPAVRTTPDPSEGKEELLTALAKT